MSQEPLPRTPEALRRLKARAPLVMVTCYDFPSAQALDGCGLDLILVGDSLGEVALGLESTTEVTLPMMVHHLGAVRRGVERTHVVCDMPARTYDTVEQALETARTLREAGADSVKLEGPQIAQVRAIVADGIPVMGHVGLTPQTVRARRKQGTDEVNARRIHDEARELARAGCYAIVVEAVPSVLARRISADLPVPTIGIASGPECDGQVLVLPDLLGAHASIPRFVHPYARVRDQIIAGVSAFRDDVRSGRFERDLSAQEPAPVDEPDVLAGLFDRIM